MGRIHPLSSGGGGTSSSDVTAAKSDVLKGKTTVTSDSNDEIVEGTLELTGNAEGGDVLSGKTFYTTDPKSKQTGSLALTGDAETSHVLYGKTFYSSDAKTRRTGTMDNRGAVTHSLPINGSYTIPAGYHNGSGKVSQSIATQGGSTTTPGTSQKTLVSAGRYVTGNIVVKGDANLIAANIKSGVNIFGVVGTCKDTTLYNNGRNIAGFSNIFESDVTFSGDGINVPDASVFIQSSGSYNFANYTKLNVDLQINEISISSAEYFNFALYDAANLGNSHVDKYTNIPASTGRKTMTIDISRVSSTRQVFIRIAADRTSAGTGVISWTGKIYRIWFS